MEVQEKYILITKALVTAGQLVRAQKHCTSLKRLVAEYNPSPSLQAAAWQLHEAAKELKELREDYYELLRKLNNGAVSTDVWAIDALNELVEKAN